MEKGTLSYIVFIKGASSTLIDAALGKDNEETIDGVGNALALYAKYQDQTIDIDEVFKHTISKNSLVEIFDDELSAIEVLCNPHVCQLLDSTTYTDTFFDFSEDAFKHLVCYKLGINEEQYPTMASLANDTEIFARIAQDEQCMMLTIAARTTELYTAMFNIQENVNAIYYSEPAVKAIHKSPYYDSVRAGAYNNSTLKVATGSIDIGGSSYATFYTGNCLVVGGRCHTTSYGASGGFKTCKYPNATGEVFSFNIAEGSTDTFCVPVADKLEGTVWSASRMISFTVIPIVE